MPSFLLPTISILCYNICMENNTTENKIYTIPSENMNRLKSKIGVIQRKAKKLGVEAPYFSIVREYEKEMQKGNDTYMVKFTDVEVNGLKAKLPGWNFLATIDHHEAGNIIRFNPANEGAFNVNDFRNVKPKCDHCNTTRNRNDTFIMSHESGELKQIGRNCIKDFLGLPSADYYAMLCELEYTLDSKDEDDLGRWSKGEMLTDISDVLKAAAMFIRLNGYRSAKMETKTTRNSVNFWMGTDEKKYSEALKEAKPEIQAADEEMAKASLDLVLSWGEEDLKSDFSRNLNILAKRGHIADRDLGMVCYMPELLMRTIQRQVEEAAKAKALKESQENSTHLGKLKERLKMEVTYTRTVYLGSSQFGDSYINFFTDDSGNALVWKTSNSLSDFTQGSKVKLVGTVKEHGEYRGVKQTSLTRCKVEAI